MRIPAACGRRYNQTLEGRYESSKADASHLLVPAQPTVEAGLVFARRFDTVTDDVL